MDRRVVRQFPDLRGAAGAYPTLGFQEEHATVVLPHDVVLPGTSRGVLGNREELDIAIDLISDTADRLGPTRVPTPSARFRATAFLFGADACQPGSQFGAAGDLRL